MLDINTYVRIILLMPKPSLKDAILDAGLKVMFRTGYHGTSVRDVTAAAGAPQGSFTNHFRSKEAFASEVLDRYFDVTRGLVAEALDDTSLTPRARLQALSRHHHRPARGRRLWPRLPDRRSQPGGIRQQRAVARTACCDLRRMARAVRRLHQGCPDQRRDRIRFRARRACRLPARVLAGRDPAHEGRPQSQGARALQDHRIPNRVQGATT